MGSERPQVVVTRQGGDQGWLVSLLRLIVAWPLAIVYWLLRLMAWGVGVMVDRLTFGPARRRRR